MEGFFDVANAVVMRALLARCRWVVAQTAVSGTIALVASVADASNLKFWPSEYVAIVCLACQAVRLTELANRATSSTIMNGTYRFRLARGSL